MTHRVLLIANKQFEVEPLVAAITSPDARMQSGPLVEKVDWPNSTKPGWRPDLTPRVRGAVDDHDFEIWCIEDLMDPPVPGGSSNTSEKARVLDLVFRANGGREALSLVIAFGTAATPQDQSRNGCVMIGRSVFVHDPYEQTPSKSPSTWCPPGLIDKVLPCLSQGSLRRSPAAPTRSSGIQARLLRPFGNPATELMVMANPEAVAVSSVNVVDYREYPRTDPEALVAANAQGVAAVASLESTHGVIRAQSEAPFLFVSGVTNRVGQFADENQAYPYTQNFVAAHNAAIATVWLLGWAVRATEARR